MQTHTRRFARLGMTLLLAALVMTLLWPRSAGAAEPDANVSRQRFLLFLVDRSDSMNGFQPPETTQAVALHSLDLAALSPEPLGIVVIFFGEDGVTVVGDENGMPSSAVGSLRRQLLNNWPDLGGTTPMDEAFQMAVRIVHDLPSDAEVSIVLMTDGQPDSGHIRADDFPEIQKIVEDRKKAISLKYQGFAPAIVQAKLAEYEQELADPTTETFETVYRQQLEFEFAKTLELASAMKKRGVRFVTLAFGHIPPLADIHEAASGVQDDLVETSPNEIIPKLHALRLLALPRIVRLPVQQFDPDPQAFERTIEVPAESIGEAMLVTVEFQPAIEEFEKRCVLEAVVDGTTYTFTASADQPEAVLATDTAGNVATATLALDSLPTSGSVTLRWWSPDGAMHAPACTVHTFLRVRSDLEAVLRPKFTPDDVRAPYRISPSHRADWTAALKLAGESKPYPIQGAEAVLHEKRQGQETRLPFSADPQSPGEFLSSPTAIAAGSYDVELLFQLGSGTSIRLLLREHIESVLLNEAISVEICQPAEGIDFASVDRRHIGFAVLGDTVRKRTVEFTLRSVEIDYLLTVRLETILADPQGNVPQVEWLQFNRSKLTLHPGRAETVRITATVPEEIERSIVDGLFEGRLSVLRETTGEPLPLTRFAPLTGVPDDEPVDPITLELKRPRFAASLPYAFKQWIVEKPDGRLEATVRVSIDHFFRRIVTVRVRHTSEEPRTVTVLPSGLIVDREGKQVPTVRLTPLETTELTQDLPPGETGTWPFLFEMDDDCSTDAADAGFNITAPGVVTEHIDVRIIRGQPLLAGMIRVLFWLLVGLFGLALVRGFVRYMRARRYRTGVEHDLTLQRPLAGIMYLEETGRGCRLVPNNSARLQLPGQIRPRPIPAERPVMLPDEIDPDTPVVLQPGDGRDEPVFEINRPFLSQSDEPELRIVVKDGGRFDRQLWCSKRTIVRCLLGTTVCAGLALSLHRPAVLTSVQWVYDALMPFS